MELAWEFSFSNNTGMLQIICIYVLLITTYFCEHLPSYCLLCALVLSLCPQMQHLQLLSYVTESAQVPWT